MRRLARSDLAYVERLFDRSAGTVTVWPKAVYPPGCSPRRGSVTFSRASDGALVLRVRPRALACEDMQLRVLFAVGVGVFATPEDLHRFAHGPLARAFGIEADGVDVEPRAELQLAEEPDEVAEPSPPDRTLLTERLAQRLAQVVRGQDAALERLAHVVCAQIAKRSPARPGTILLLGPTGSGKTSAVEGLPGALASLGHRGAHVFRVDCNELAHAFQVSRLIGAPPGYVGHDSEPRLLRALEQPGCILLLDEVDRAHPSVLTDVLLNLVDTGRLSAPNGATVDAAHCVIAMTSNLASDELDARLHRIPLDNRWAVQRACRELLEEEGMPAELVGRIGALAVFRPLDGEALREAAALAIKAVVREYKLCVGRLDPVLADVVLDIARGSGLGARALHHAASELLADALVTAVAHGVEGAVEIAPGPPVAVFPRGAE